MGRVAITYMVGLPWPKAESRAISQLNIEEPAQTKDDMPLGTPVIGNISPRVHVQKISCWMLFREVYITITTGPSGPEESGAESGN